ncbi:MAG: nucleotide exchange factor GrpE [Vicinamibacterales bacterium]
MADEPLTPQPSEDETSTADQSTSEIETLKRERDEHYDRLLRKTAEFDNYRKRVERERREQGDRAVVGLLEELLLVVDDFDLALTVDAGEGGAPYRKGVELIHAKLHDMLRKQGVKAIEALGEDFDPNLHQAVMHEPSAHHREGEVIGELRKGYTLNDRLLRPSMVKVAKA